jgi:hypothetical protein
MIGLELLLVQLPRELLIDISIFFEEEAVPFEPSLLLSLLWLQLSSRLSSTLPRLRLLLRV